ncbi:hypothetical protein TWF730_002120 [Orbilia blumenaviensis]|uniref:Uncharacterized protein n=1 Tax=Orbilia blumenaviensis TaxID=1796055 RepID=A0AAV9UDN0_9PEZI
MKSILFIVTSLLFVFLTKAFPLPGFDNDLSLPDDFKMKSIEEIAHGFGFVSDGNGTFIDPTGKDGIRTGLEAHFGTSNLEGRGPEWQYTCSRRVGPQPLVYWLNAFIYVTDRLKKVPGNCRVNPNDGCSNCACTGGAAVKLCRGGTSPANFQVPNGEVAFRSEQVTRVFILSMMNMARCGGSFPGCNDPYNCQFEGMATFDGISENWYVYLTQEREIPRCIPI